MTDELYHHGIKGMRWGIRRYQNADGSLTPAGKARLKKYKDKQHAKYAKRSEVLDKQHEDVKNRMNKAYSKGNISKQERYMSIKIDEDFLSAKKFMLKEYDKAVDRINYNDMVAEKRAATNEFIKQRLSLGFSSDAYVFGTTDVELARENTRMERLRKRYPNENY